MLNSNKFLKRIITDVLVLIYSASIFCALVTGAAHEIHHIITHTLDMHHHHGQRHTNHSTDTYHTHDHGRLMDAFLNAQESDEENEEEPALTALILHEHLSVRQINTIDYFHENDRRFFTRDINKPKQYISKPETPPPRYPS